ncbi:HlyD family type I secretion periplasmic adaptor subunit [Methylobacterium persicinum]|uniref:Membrane fusion protein (MFP) family protein n=1 Tax=Methylobacterium persicinum TaxID=374426 RepID=A0ABU0HM20_9HYPH|nr:HlyD family type I secretion periplasmic adaptor subunit [Methylobacterium persicinum]MDQ0443376.1 HlyD family secretion protein [Methylobacterium persicinum]
MPALVSPLSGLAAAPEISSAMRRHLRLALLLQSALVGAAIAATTINIAAAVIAPGQLVVESDHKKVQHPTGGVVSSLLVRDGDHVRAGDLLVRLDDTQTRANLDIVVHGLDELASRRARCEAELDGSAAVSFPDDLVARVESDKFVAKLIDGERRLFVTRAAAREGQRAQLRERIAQYRQEITGLTEQAEAKAREIALIATELQGVRELYAKNLVQLTRVTALERDAARLAGERGQLIATTASTRGKISEAELQILQVDEDMRAQVGREVADIRGKWAELVERRVAAQDQLQRVEMRAPQDGTVHQMAVHTIGGVLAPNEPAMLIVPDGDHLLVEVHVQPQDIDNVAAGQAATLRFPAFNAKTTPEVDGEVRRVSADVTQDARSGQSFYTARIALGPDAQAKLGSVRLVPGMPAEAHVVIGERTILSYLTKPLADQIARAWRER